MCDVCMQGLNITIRDNIRRLSKKVLLLRQRSITQNGGGAHRKYPLNLSRLYEPFLHILGMAPNVTTTA